MPDNSQRILEIDAQLASGVTYTQVGDMQVRIDADLLRQERERLIAEDPNFSHRRRPSTAKINLGSF